MTFQIAWARLVKSGLYRACRAALFAFAGYIGSRWVEGDGGLSVTALVDTIEAHADYAGGAALIAAALSFGWRVGLDRLPIPTLRDAPLPVQQTGSSGPLKDDTGKVVGTYSTGGAPVPSGPKPYEPGTGV